jgi:tetratricopeptide (TPR) repeat protein
VTDVRKALEAEREVEREFVAEARKSETAPTGWPAALVMFHVCMWRERLNNALIEVREGRAYNPPPANIDEANDAELAGGLGVALVDIAERADVLLASLVKLWEELGERPFKWYISNTTAEAILRNSYIHPRNHIVAYLNENGEPAAAQQLQEDAASEMREVAAPPSALGAALYNLACVRVAQDRTDEALELLIEAFPMRPDLKAGAAKDEDLEALHDNPAFKALTQT